MNNDLIKVYCGELLDDYSYLEILNPNFGFKKRKNIFGDKDVFDDFKEKIVEVTKDITQSDFILIPHNYFQIKNKLEYLSNIIDLSKRHFKKIIIFAIGDSAEDIQIENSIIFRMSQYKSRKKENEIIIPAYASDLSYGVDVTYRGKQAIPTIGFCGWASIGGFAGRISFFIKNLFLKGPYKQGIYFRKRAIGQLSKTGLVKTNFIVRDSYNANEKTIKLDPIKAREEYRQNIINSDFLLSPKGDGNYSVRFYEILSLGRVPVLIDTDSSLPLEDKIDYSKFILKISYQDINKIDKIISEFYAKLSESEWLEMQKFAREVFLNELKADVFLKKALQKQNINKYK